VPLGPKLVLELDVDMYIVIFDIPKEKGLEAIGIE
jgi:hypothetical protein